LVTWYVAGFGIYCGGVGFESGDIADSRIQEKTAAAD
jgi:hypothetical protein